MGYRYLLGLPRIQVLLSPVYLGEHWVSLVDTSTAMSQNVCLKRSIGLWRRSASNVLVQLVICMGQ